MTDALITELAQIRSVRVISRTSVMRYKKTVKDLPEIARELNVEGIVEGTIQRSGIASDHGAAHRRIGQAPLGQHLRALSGGHFCART